uniref:Uncharacterized protein n=1 Tax=Octopus bimaculoides TaxID=37653 RepID=A0A0L8HYI7_OCTBM
MQIYIFACKEFVVKIETKLNFLHSNLFKWLGYSLNHCITQHPKFMEAVFLRLLPIGGTIYFMEQVLMKCKKRY